MTGFHDDALQIVDFERIALAEHERYMRLAIEEGRRNLTWPFGAVIVDARNGEVVARGVNEASKNPTFHGEIVTLNNFVRDHGNVPLNHAVLYTTAEPCPMCMSALVWAGLGGIVFGTSLRQLVRFGIGQIMIDAAHVCRQAGFYRGEVLGSVLARETDELFRFRPVGR